MNLFQITSLTVVALLFAITGNSQSSHSYMWETEFDLEWGKEEPWSHSFSIGNRGLIKERMESETLAEGRNLHLEIQHFSHYTLNTKTDVGFGVRYRFREAFDKSLHDEFRLMQEIGYGSESGIIILGHRGRFEQRFRGPETIFRLRYQLEAGYPLSEVFELQASTEALYAVSAQAKPEAEQRFTLQIENSSFEKVGISLGAEYRLEDYINRIGYEYFVFTGVSLKL